MIDAPKKVDPKPKRKKKKTHSIYKGVAAKMQNLIPMPFLAYTSNISTTTGSNDGISASAGKKKQKKKKKRKTKKNSGVLFMKELSFNDAHEISLLLDVGFGANWKQLAALYGIDTTTIHNIKLAVNNESPTQNLLRLLQTRIPDLKVQDFMEKCGQISRNDVVVYIQNNVL